LKNHIDTFHTEQHITEIFKHHALNFPVQGNKRLKFPPQFPKYEK